LVRGAYHPHEVAAHEEHMAGKLSTSISSEAQPPVWLNKEETDECYNECAKVLVTKIKQDIENSHRIGISKVFGKSSSAGRRQHIGVLFGTHNWTSTRLILNQLVNSGLASIEGNIEDGIVTIPDEVTERLTMGQLYGW